MKLITINDIRSWRPCYDPNRYLAETWKGTALDILNDARIPFEDRLWVIMRTEIVSEKLMRLFAVWCARQVQHLMTDERSLHALDVAEAFANGQASRDELAAAWDAARDAAWDAAWDATRAAAWAAAWVVVVTVRDATWDAVWAVASAAQEQKLREMLIAGVETGDVK